MTQKLRGILIDPIREVIEEVVLDKKDLFEQLYVLCRCDIIQCVTRHSLDRPLYMFFDEEGAYKDFAEAKGFALLNDESGINYEMFHGTTVLLGPPDKKSNTLGAPEWCTVESITPLIVWPEDEEER